MELIQALNWRYAVKKFTDSPLPNEKVKALLEATRLSPSAYGLQPYQILVVNSPNQRRELLAHSMGQDKIINSSHLLILASYTDIDKHLIDNHMHLLSSNRELTTEALEGMNSHYQQVLINNKTLKERQQWAVEQTYIALGTLLTSAALLQIDACPMTGFDAKGYDQVLGLAEKSLTATVLCTLGERHPEDNSAHLPTVRRDYNDLIIELSA